MVRTFLGIDRQILFINIWPWGGMALNDLGLYNEIEM